MLLFCSCIHVFQRLNLPSYFGMITFILFYLLQKTVSEIKFKMFVRFLH